ASHASGKFASVNSEGQETGPLLKKSESGRTAETRSSTSGVIQIKAPITAAMVTAGCERDLFFGVEGTVTEPGEVMGRDGWASAVSMLMSSSPVNGRRGCQPQWPRG